MVDLDHFIAIWKRGTQEIFNETFNDFFNNRAGGELSQIVGG